MMKWRKSPAGLITTFDAVVPADPRVERRKMFGYPCAFVGGNMFTGLHQEDLILRLPEAERAEFLRFPGARTFEPMPGRPMKEYAVVPPGMLDHPGELRTWLARSLAYAASLPVKKKEKKGGGAAKPAAKKPRPKKQPPPGLTRGGGARGRRG